MRVFSNFGGKASLKKHAASGIPNENVFDHGALSATDRKRNPDRFDKHSSQTDNAVCVSRCCAGSA